VDGLAHYREGERLLAAAEASEGLDGAHERYLLAAARAHFHAAEAWVALHSV
jgi:hypothetical protein